MIIQEKELKRDPAGNANLSSAQTGSYLMLSKAVYFQHKKCRPFGYIVTPILGSVFVSKISDVFIALKRLSGGAARLGDGIGLHINDVRGYFWR